MSYDAEALADPDGADYPRNYVRLLVSDTAQDDPLFTDGEVDAFLASQGDDEYLAAALALRVIAGNEAQVQKVIRLLDLDSNGAALASSLRSLADDYEQRSEQGGFAVAEQAVGIFGTRRRWGNEWLRARHAAWEDAQQED